MVAVRSLTDAVAPLGGRPRAWCRPGRAECPVFPWLGERSPAGSGQGESRVRSLDRADRFGLIGLAVMPSTVAHRTVWPAKNPPSQECCNARRISRWVARRLRSRMVLLRWSMMRRRGGRGGSVARSAVATRVVPRTTATTMPSTSSNITGSGSPELASPFVSRTCSCCATTLWQTSPNGLRKTTKSPNWSGSAGPSSSRSPLQSVGYMLQDATRGISRCCKASPWQFSGSAWPANRADV
jgi:hypothetical protein